MLNKIFIHPNKFNIMKKVAKSKLVIMLCSLWVAFTILNVSAENTVTINVKKAETVIPHEVFGVLMERLGRQWSGKGAIFVGTNSSTKNTNGMRQDVIDGFVECGVGAIEWPGGCAANGYNWSSNKNPSNDVGVDRFIEFCKLTKAEAIICGRPSSGDAPSNEAFCKYILEDLDYPLKWFKVGNEVWGCGGNQNVNGYMSSYTANYNRLKELKNHKNGKNLSIIAGNDMETRWSWLPTMLKGIGEKMDGVEYHDYIYFPNAISSSNPSTNDYWKIMGAVLKSDMLPNVDKRVLPALDSYDPDKRIKCILDEWGHWLMDTGDNWMQRATMMDGLSAAIHLNVFIHRCDRIAAACLAQGVSVIHSLMNINTNGQMVKTPTFYVFKMFKSHHANNAKFIPITSSNFDNTNNLPAVSIGASVDDSSTVNLSFSNIDLSKSQSITVTLDSDIEGYTVKSAEIVTGDDYKSGNDFGKEETIFIKELEESAYTIEGNVLTAKLPAKSIVMIRLIPSVTSLRRKRTDAQRAATFSVTAEKNGTLLLNSTATGSTPVKISMYTVDGRIMEGSIKKTLTAGKNRVSFGNGKLRSGVYLVEISSPHGIHYLQKVTARK